MLKRTLLTLSVAFLAVAGHSAAQQEPGSELRVYLLTMGQGVEVYERFGHNAIWIHDPVMGTDTAYNWGEFSFEQPHFIRRFLQGKMLYWMGALSMDFMVYAYQVRQRTMWVQELNLTPAQKRQLQDFVRWNAREANKYYTYDYYRDNCSTRVRDVLDRVLGGSLQSTLKARTTRNTYRSYTRELMLADITPTEGMMMRAGPTEPDRRLTNVALLTGMDLAMGPRIDQPLSEWEAAFIPMELQSSVRSITVSGPAGQQSPLVLSERVLVDAHRPPPSSNPPFTMNGYLVVGVLVAGVLAVLGALTRRRWARTLFLLLAGVWTLLIGVLGAIIGALWAFTDHVVTYGNENLLQANPLALLLCAALLGLGLRRDWGRKFAFRTSFVLAGLAVLGFMIQALPGVDQVNGNIIALLLPAHIAIAWVLQKWPARQPATVRVD